MENELDDYEEEEEILEEETVETSKQKSKSKIVEDESNKPTERYAAFYQEEKVGIIDTITEEIVTEGIPLPQAKLEAFKLNLQDKISIATGAK